jgi:UDP-N-acetylmuramyl pentapeptide phosphotransferase/UDP-N-acetylglucosamine-1-phosphate transferase/uncharacterized membrane protein
VILATLAVAWGAAALLHPLPGGDVSQLLALTTAAGLLAVVGGIDDVHGLAPLPRLITQCAAVVIVITVLPHDLRLLPMLPWWIEATCLLIGGIWFVNLTNFMDGIDWMTVAEVVPVTGAIVLLGLLGIVAPLPTLVALALLGAMLGFAPFNKPVARLFLGDVGSLPIGLVLGWLLLRVAGRGELAAALILPLHYVADATLTLIRRMAAGEPIWQAHRSHFYQRAIDGGFTVPEIIARVFAVNLALVALALIAVATASRMVSLAALIVYIYPAVVAVLSLRFGRRLEGRRAWFALGLALVGVALALGGIPSGEMPPISGLALIVVSPLIYSVWIILSARLAGERRESVGDRVDGGADAAAATALMMTGTAVSFWLIGSVSGVPLAPASIPAAAWPGLVGVGVVATFIAIQTFYAGAQRIGAAQAALVSTIEPFWTIALAALLFNESLAPPQILGGALIIIGVLIAQAPVEAFSSIRPGVRLADE